MFHDIHLLIICINLWSKNMNVSSITPKLEENINIIKALEFLAYNWKPFVDDDELITNPDRIDKRTNNYFFTDNDMIKATAKLTYLIRNRKITLNPNDIIPVKENLYTSSLIASPDNYIKINVSATKKNMDTVENGSIKSVQIKYLKIDNDTLPPYLYGKSLIRINTDKMNCYYIPICIIDYGFSKFIYPDCNGIIKFSKLETCYEDEILIKKENINKVIDDSAYTTPLIQIANAMIMKYGDKINKETTETVLDLIMKQGKTLGYNDISKNERMAIFKVIRHPDTKKGGAKPQGTTPEL